MDKMFDLIVIGGGPGGTIAAERAGARGQKVLLVEKDLLGGVCLNWGCIPTKALLHSAKIFYHAQQAETMGVTVQSPRYDLKQAMVWKEKAVITMRRGVEFLMKRHHVNVVKGEGCFIDKNTVEVAGEKYTAENIIIAVGSSPLILPVPGHHLPHVVTSKEILNIDKLPEKLVIVGGGVIGIEFASYFSMLGVSVSIIEMMDEILPNFDTDIASLLRKSISNCTFHLNSRVDKIDEQGIHFTNSEGSQTIEADKILVSIGRRPNTAGLNLDKLNIDFDESGIRINDKMQTNIPTVYAIGDVTGRSMLAHSASKMGEIAVNTLCGEEDHMDFKTIPWVVYSYPEVSGVGVIEKELKDLKESFKIKTVPLRSNGRFISENGNERGLCKVIIDEKQLLRGIQIVGGVNSEMIYGAAAMIQQKLSIKDIDKMIFPHPTLSEIIKDSLREFIEQL